MKYLRLQNYSYIIGHMVAKIGRHVTATEFREWYLSFLNPNEKYYAFFGHFLYVSLENTVKILRKICGSSQISSSSSSYTISSN